MYNQPANPLWVQYPYFKATFEQSLTVFEMQQWGVLSFGLQNNYPQIVRAAIENCGTAKRASSIMARFLAGDGFVDPTLDKIKVNKKGWTGSQLKAYMAQQAAMYNAVALDLRLNSFGQIVEVYPISYQLVRLGFGFYEANDKAPKNWQYDDIKFGRKDLTGYCAVFDNWAGESPRSNASINMSDFIWLPMYEGDRREDFLDSFTDYREYGQSIYYRPLIETENYAQAVAHSEINSMLSYQDESTFTQKEFKNGLSAGHLVEIAGAFESEEREKRVRENFQQVQGAENAGSLLIIAGGVRNTDTGAIESMLKVTPIDRGNAYEMFKELGRRIDERITTTYGVPPALLSIKSDAVFSSQNRYEDYEYYNNVLEMEKQNFQSLIDPIFKGLIGEDVNAEILSATYKTTKTAI